MPDPIRKTSPSHGFALAWPMPCGGQEEVRESGCLLIAGAEVGQNPGSEETKALGPNSTPAPLPRIFPFATQFLQMTKAALLHQQPTAPTPRPARPRALQLTAFSSAPFATPVKARQTSGSEVGMGTAPSGAPPAPQSLPPYLPTYFRLAARSKHGFLGAPPTSGNHLPK